MTPSYPLSTCIACGFFVQNSDSKHTGIITHVFKGRTKIIFFIPHAIMKPIKRWIYPLNAACMLPQKSPLGGRK